MDEQKRNDMNDDDLERYGVWVKAGPEEVVDADDDFSFEDLPPTAVQGEEQTDSFDVPDIEELDLDDFDDTPATPRLDLDDTPDDLSIPSLSTTSDEDENEYDDGDLVSIDDLDLEEPEEDRDPFAVLDETEEVEPEEVEGESDAVTDEFDLEELTDSLDDDFEEITIDTGDEVFDSTIPGSDDEIETLDFEDLELDEDDSEELPELAEEHDFTPDKQGIEIVPQPVANHLTPEEEEFLAEEENLQNSNESAIPKMMDTQEREAFDRIQTELSDIKRELAELKDALRAGSMQQVVIPEGPTPQIHAEERIVPDISDFVDDNLDDVSEADAEVDSEEERVSGFFEEDEDETIALTGDELDNILNTAEFTEQAGEAEELDDDFLVDSVEPEQPDFAVTEIEMEPLEEELELEDDHPAVNELAEMDIDQELSDIDSLTDETEEEDDDEIEIDLDSLDGIEAIEDEEIDEEIEEEFAVEDVTEEVSEEESEDEEDFDSFATAVEQDIAEAREEEPGSFDEIEEIELDDAFDAEETTEEVEQESDEFDDEDNEIELDLDDLEVEDIDLDEEDDFSPGTVIEATVDQDDEVEEEEEEEFPEEGDLEVEFDVEISGQKGTPSSIADLPEDLKQEIRSVLSYMDQLLEALPDDKIEEFAQSEHFDVYKRLFEELGLET